jgi:hypothetical protein
LPHRDEKIRALLPFVVKVRLCPVDPHLGVLTPPMRYHSYDTEWEGYDNEIDNVSVHAHDPAPPLAA